MWRLRHFASSLAEIAAAAEAADTGSLDDDGGGATVAASDVRGRGSG